MKQDRCSLAPCQQAMSTTSYTLSNKDLVARAVTAAVKKSGAITTGHLRQASAISILSASPSQSTWQAMGAPSSNTAPSISTSNQRKKIGSMATPIMRSQRTTTTAMKWTLKPTKSNDLCRSTGQTNSSRIAVKTLSSRKARHMRSTR